MTVGRKRVLNEDNRNVGNAMNASERCKQCEGQGASMCISTMISPRSMRYC